MEHIKSATIQNTLQHNANKNIYIYIYTHTHTHTYTYIHTYIHTPTVSAFYINVIYVLINQGDIFFKSVMFRFLQIFNGLSNGLI